MRLAAVPAIAALLVLGACDQPKFRDTSKSAAAPAGAPAAAPPARVIPSVAGPTPPPPAWAAGVIGKGLREAYPKTGICRGNTDIVQQTYAGPPAGVQVHGWGWDLDKKARIERVVLVDKSMKVVGAGQGGVARPDVTAAAPEIPDGNTGWNADVPLTAGPLEAFGVVGDGTAVCPLGRLEF